MFKVLSAVLVCVAVASAASFHQQTASISRSVVGASPMGVVDPAYRCGGVGTPVQLRISGCEGYCKLQPGSLYELEEDFFPSSAAPQLTLKVTITFMGFDYVILEANLANSSIQPGYMYTVKYNIVPNDVMSGNTVQFKGEIMHTDTKLVEICVAADIDIL